MSRISYDSMTTLSITDFKDLCDTLSRFADIRETAKEPRDRVVMQVGGGRMKFIAGTEDTTVVVDAGPAEGKAKAVVKARLLLHAAKAVRGRGSVRIEVNRAGALLEASTGGRVTLASFTSLVPDFVRPPKKSEASTVRDHPGFGLASRVFPAITSKHHPCDKVYLTSADKLLYLTATDQRSFGRWAMSSGMAFEGSLGALPRDLFPAMRDLVEPGPLAFGDGRVAIRSGRFLVGARLLGEAVSWANELPEASDNVQVVAERKPLIDALRGMAGSDAHARVRLLARGDELLVENWEGAGSMSLGALIDGDGRVGVDADRMRKLLTALPGKSVRIEFDGSRPGNIRLTAEEATGWQTLLAPVA